jgi:hypothetical protein
MSTTTRIVKTLDIAESDFASVIVRLMMAVNDMVLTNVALEDWCKSDDKRKVRRRSNGRMFFARVQVAFVFEALDMIKEIRASDPMKAHVDRCDDRTKECFKKVCDFIDSNDHALLAEVRSSAVFHYDPKRAVRAITEMSKKDPEDRQSYTLGDELLDWHYELADKSHERNIVHHIFKVAEDADIGKESDAIMNRIFDMSEALALFASGFIAQLTK